MRRATTDFVKSQNVTRQVVRCCMDVQRERVVCYNIKIEYKIRYFGCISILLRFRRVIRLKTYNGR